MSEAGENEDTSTKEGWYCLKTQVKREHIAAVMIRQRVQIEVFSPRITYTKKTVRGKVRFTEALFPGYIFVYTSITKHLRHLKAIQGVQGIVRYGQRIPHIPGELIEELKKKIPEENLQQPDPIIEVGASVDVVEGPFQHLQAVVTQVMTPKERVRILLEFLGRQSEVDIPISAILPTSHDPKKGL